MTGDEVREVLESFDLGRWRLAWDRHLRLVPSLPKLPEIPVSSPPTTSPAAVSSSSDDPTMDADAAFLREIEAARQVTDPRGLLPWIASIPDTGDGTVGSDAKYQQMLAEEICDDQVAADAAVAFAPDVPLPFGGESKE